MRIETRRLTPISPPPVKSADLFRPVVLGNRSAAVDVDTVASILSAVFVSSTGAPSLTWHPTPIEALAPPKAEDAGASLRGLETQSCHIGSTAIPGIVAKPVIDILLEVERIERLDQQVAAMQRLGYEALGEFGIPGRRYFRKNDGNGTRTHHVHGFLAGSDGAIRHVAFRAYMVAHLAEAQAYGALKERLASRHPDDIEAYMDGKDAFIKDREHRALEWWASQKR